MKLWVFRPLLLASMGLLGGALPAWSHHSTAIFDYPKTVTVMGTIKDFQWGNPHSYIQILVPDPQGGSVEWSIETGTPSGMTRMGWTPESLKRGDKVTVAFAPARDGTHVGTVKRVTFPNGRVLTGMADAIPTGDGKAPVGPQLPTLEHATPK